jgi:hypothetical protein
VFGFSPMAGDDYRIEAVAATTVPHRGRRPAIREASKAGGEFSVAAAVGGEHARLFRA